MNERVDPPCPHFSDCGGCTLQHWREDDYISWKCEQLVAALHRAGYSDVSLSPLVRTAAGERRRMDLAVRRTRDGISLGLHRLRSAEVVDLTTCLVLHPKLVELFVPLRSSLGRLQGLQREGSVIANLLDSGIDLLLRTDAPLTLGDRLVLTELANRLALSRIAWAKGSGEPEPVAILRPPTTTLSGVEVTLPPGAFLQASVAGETAIVAAVLKGLPARLANKSRVAELYAGCGSITFALAQRARVTAWEGDADAVSTLRTAANRSRLNGRIDTIQRDLARQPLQASELRDFAALVLDPPFAGAAAQVKQIAAARIPNVAYVSCNPATFARDAHMLRAAGYSLISATPIDQFLWSAGLESVCSFRR